MTTISKYIVALVLCLCVNGLSAQEKKTDSIISNSYKQLQIDKLLEKKEEVKAQEKAYLKREVEVINEKLDDGKITASEAEELKRAAATKRAKNIEDRLAIIDSRIELIKRNTYQKGNDDFDSETMFVSVGPKGLRIDLEKGEPTPPKYDIRTGNKLVFAMGFNNAIGDGQSLDDSPYKLGGSGFVELGWLWSTRIFENSNFARFNYGFSFQWNKLNVKDNQYFVQNGDVTSLEQFPLNLKKAKFRTTNLVLPIHLELGPSTKRDYGDRIRYFDDKFRIGIGGYGGVRLGTQQKLVFEDADGNRVKSKEKRNFNTSNFVYGLSAYVGWSDISLYAKYDLSPMFKDQAFDQNNISLGLRWDLD